MVSHPDCKSGARSGCVGSTPTQPTNKWIALALLALLALEALLYSCIFPLPVYPATPPCASVEEQMARDYGEHPVWMGLSRSGYALVLLESPETGTWTLVAITPDGVCHAVDAGDGATKLPNSESGPEAAYDG